MLTHALLLHPTAGTAPVRRSSPSHTCFRAPALRQKWSQRASQRPCRQRALPEEAPSKFPNIVEVDGAGLEVEIMNRDRPLVIDFYAMWCGPCLLLAKELETVAKELGNRVRILKIDTDVHHDISTQLQIQGLPTLIFVGMDPEKPALRTEGLLPAHVIMDIVEQELEKK